VAAQDPERSDELTEVEPPTVVRSIIGLMALLTGVVAATFTAWALQIAYVREEHDVGPLTIAALVAPIAWFFLESGIRLLTNRPSRCRSILALSSWKWLGIWCAAVAVWILYLGSRSNLPAGVLGAAIFGAAGWHCRNRIRDLKAQDSARAAV
jgi:hypothetical protein